MSNVKLNDAGQELRRGDEWYVYMPGDAILQHVRIVDVTNLTVQLELMPKSYIPMRYETKKIKFIERVEK